jgi:hypothetical protein
VLFVANRLFFDPPGSPSPYNRSPFAFICGSRQNLRG